MVVIWIYIKTLGDRPLDLLYDSQLLYSLILLNLFALPGNSLPLVSILFCTHHTKSTGMVPSFIHVNLLSLPTSSETALAGSSSWHLPVHRSTIELPLVSVSENTHVLCMSGSLIWQATAVPRQHPLRPSTNLKKRRLTLQTKSW